MKDASDSVPGAFLAPGDSLHCDLSYVRPLKVF